MAFSTEHFPESEYLLQLDSEELAWVNTKRHNNQLAFAVMLKYFQFTGNYPVNTNAIPEGLMTCLANQLEITADALDHFDWKSITTKRFRQEIRRFLGYRKVNANDKENLIKWLIKEILIQAPTLPQCHEKITQYFRELKLEPIASQELNRHVRTAYFRFEKQFFSKADSQLSQETKNSMQALLQEDDEDLEDENPVKPLDEIKFKDVKKNITGHKLNQINYEIDKLKRLRMINLPHNLFESVTRKVILKYHARISTELPSEIIKHPTETRYAMMAAFCHIQYQKRIDDLADLLIQLIHKLRTSAEGFINKKILSEVKCVNGKFDILYLLAKISTEKPKGIIEQEIYPQVDQETLHNLTKELQSRGNWYQTKVQVKMRSLYSHAHRRALLNLLDIFQFQSNHPDCQLLLQAIALIKQNRDCQDKYYPQSSMIPIKNTIPVQWQDMVVESDLAKNSQPKDKKINRMNYEIAVLEELREKLICKSIWIEEAYHYRDPDEDVPKDFKDRPEFYYQTLNLPMNADDFIKTLKGNVQLNLQLLNDDIPTNKKVIISNKQGGRIKISPSPPQPEPKHINSKSTGWLLN